MTFADVGNGLAVFGPEIPALVATLVALAYCASRALTGISETTIETEREYAT